MIARCKAGDGRAARELNVRRASNYFRAGAEIVAFDDTDPASAGRATARAEALVRARGGVAVLFRLPSVPGPWSRFRLVGQASEGAS